MSKYDIDITGLNKAEVLAALCSEAIDRAYGTPYFGQPIPPLQEVSTWLDKNGLVVVFYHNYAINVDLSGTVINLQAFELANGLGTADKAVKAIGLLRPKAA